MRFAFVNPNWDFTDSTYFGCREEHFPLELLYPAQRVRAEGHESLLIDAQLEKSTAEVVKERIEAFRPDFLVVPTAPSYLFWRCPQPELRVAQEWIEALDCAATKVIIGPHASATPRAALRKTGADVALRGEPDLTIVQLADRKWREIEGCCFGEHMSSTTAVADMKELPALDLTDYPLESRTHRHHVFTGKGRGAELEFARGCPWACTFCNKTLFRNRFRERNVETVITEIDALIARGVDYVYFIDEIFGVGKNVLKLLEAIADRRISIGIQTRIDLWTEETLELLARAHCISMECGVESITAAGREKLNKNCHLSTERIAELLIYARQRIPWVQANLILTAEDDRGAIHRWQERLKSHGVWVSEPVPMYPFPGSPLYVQTFGEQPDDHAWERAHEHYLSRFGTGDFSDIQTAAPRSIEELECTY